MTGKSHVAGGIGVAGISVGMSMYVLKHYEPAYRACMPMLYHAKQFLFPPDLNVFVKILLVAVSISAFIFGTLAPDMDNPKSIAGRVMHIPVGHRTILHSLWFVGALILIGCANVILRPFIFCGLGSLAHLICDMFSVKGIKLLWPVRIGRHWLKFYTTGEPSEYVFLGFIIFTAVVSLIAGLFL